MMIIDMNKWINVNKKLPEHHSSILVYTKTGAQCVTIFLNDKFTTKFLNDHGINVTDDHRGHAFCSQEIRGLVLNGVTHWMPLPEPPHG